MASRSSNRAEVPEAKEALDRFKMEVAQELGVPLSDSYNGNLTSAQNGSVGGYMVKNMSPERNMTFQRKLTHHKGAKTTPIEYHYTLVI